MKNQIIEDILTALFAVAGWNLETSHGFVKTLLNKIPEEIDSLRDLNEDDIARLIVASGFSRGSKVLAIMVERMTAVLQFVSKENIEGLKCAVSSGQYGQIRDMLLSVKGVGPKVVSNFFLLQGIEIANS